MMPKKKTWYFRVSHVKQEPTLELLHSYWFVSGVGGLCKNLEEAEVETCLKTITLLLCMTFLTPNGDKDNYKDFKHTLGEELCLPLESFD